MRADWVGVVVVLAALTMTLGNLVALTQDNIKRMLAYTSIAHTGYILVGLAAFAGAPAGSTAASAGIAGVLFYSVAYTFMNLGAFAVVAALQGRPGVTSQIATFAGLGRRAPLPRRADAAVPAVADRHPADGRLLRQGVRHRGRAPVGRLVPCWP